MTAETEGREPEDRDGVDPAASGGAPDPEGQRRTGMSEMGVPGATGGGPAKLVAPEEAEDRLAATLGDQPVNRAEVTDPGLGEPGSAGHDDRRGAPHA